MRRLPAEQVFAHECYGLMDGVPVETYEKWRQYVDAFFAGFKEGVKADHMPTPCMLWVGSVTSEGYGRFRVEGEDVLVHRLAWQLAGYAIPVDKIVRHACDVRACGRDSHLLLGTPAQNRQDAVHRGRYQSPRGAAPRNLLKGRGKK